MVRAPNRQNIAGVLKKLGEITNFMGTHKDGGYALYITVAFGCPAFQWGNYTATIGLNQAAIALDHPGFDCDEFYQALLNPKEWKEKIKDKSGVDSKLGLGGKLKLLLGFASISADGEMSKSNSHSGEVESTARYSLVSRQAQRWVIGSELGDPRKPHSILMGNCLSGTYCDGDGNAETTGTEIKIGKNNYKAFCVITAKAGANDDRVRCMLIAPVGALRIEITHSAPILAGSLNPVAAIDQKEQRENALRNAIAQICYDKIKQMESEDKNAIGEHLLSGELLIAEKLNKFQIASEKKPTIALISAIPARSGAIK